MNLLGPGRGRGGGWVGGWGGGVGNAQRGFVDDHLRRGVGEGDANKQGVLKILEDDSVVDELVPVQTN